MTRKTGQFLDDKTSVHYYLQSDHEPVTALCNSCLPVSTLNISHKIKISFQRGGVWRKVELWLLCLPTGWKYKGQHRDKDSISANISSTLGVSMSRGNSILWRRERDYIPPGWNLVGPGRARFDRVIDLIRPRHNMMTTRARPGRPTPPEGDLEVGNKNSSRK